MGKGKLQRFAEMKTFPNVFEPTMEEVKTGSYHLKGKWHEQHFKNNHPINIELGCGRAEYTVNLAKKYPKQNFIGMDIKGARIWRGAKTAVENKMENVGFIRTRIDFIENFFAKDEISEIWITFPDPQPKKARKRLTSPMFLNRYKKFLKLDGVIHLKTDNRELFDYTQEIIDTEGHKLLFSSPDVYRETGERKSKMGEDVTEITTHYEKIFRNEGKRICYLKFCF